jgi:hypothetical protein
VLLEDLFNTSENNEIIPISIDVGKTTRESFIPRPSDNSGEVVP